MYEEFYGLEARPFSLLPDPAFLFMSRKHAIALSLLEYAASSDLALSVATGEVGSGKTTLIRQLMRELDDSYTIGLISNTHRDFSNLMQMVAMAYGLPFKDKESVELYQDLSDFLIDEYAAGRRTILIVDEAQNLDVETLEEIRLLTNINADDHTVLQLLLVGQPELHDVLKRHELRQLAQRIGVVAKLEPLDEKETAEYVSHRIEVAGGDPKLFHKNALRLVHWNSGGIPRVINTLCELALVYGYADQKKRIDATLIADIARDRIDTGLYNTPVIDLKQLKAEDAKTSKSKPAAKRTKSRAARAVKASDILETSDETIDITGHGESSQNIVDLIVDGDTKQANSKS